MDDQGGQGDLAALLDARDRLGAAFARVAEAAARLAERPDPSAPEAERLGRLLEEERVANAQLEERLRALKARAEAEAADLRAERDAARAEVARLEALDAQRAAEVEAVLSELLPIIEEAR